MTDEMYIWLEEHGGTSFNIDDEIEGLSTGGLAFVDPYSWFLGISNVINLLDEAKQVVDENWRELYDELPSRTKFKKMLERNTVDKLYGVVKQAFKELNLMVPSESMTINTILNTASAMVDLVEMMTANDIEDILQNQLFEKYEESHDDAFSELLGIAKQDLSSISFAIDGIRESYMEDEE